VKLGLRVYTLGSPSIEWDGRALDIPRRQARALLYYLAAHLQPVPREQLCFLFWPDTPESSARRNFSRLLTHLRRALPTPEALAASTDHVGLDPGRAWSDAATFERLCNAPGAPPRTEALQEAVDLYRGPFLAGFSLPGAPEFEEWVVQEQQSRERQYLEALTTLIETRTAGGEYAAAIEYALRYLAVDDLAEDVHRRLIELYAASGDQRAALRQFERCAALLERELDVGPLPETQAAYEAVLQGRSRPPQRAAPPTWTTLPSLEAPLIGRKEALYWLTQAYSRARSGHGRVVLISGEPGVGKSRLMQDFVSGLEDEATLVIGGGHEAEQDLAYWPLIEAFRPRLAAVNWTTLDVEPPHLAEVARLLPELRTLIPHLPPLASVEPGQEQGRLFLALTHWLLGLAAQRPPLILCLDDLHWADEATLSWLGYLGRRLERTPVLVLGAYRAQETPGLATLRAGLVRLGLLQDVMLKGLLPSEVLRLLRRLFGQSSGIERLSRRLYRETGGNPFFLLETVRAMFETGLLQQDKGAWSTDVDEADEDCGRPLSDTVYEAIRDRLRRLSPQAQQVLEAGAIIGRQFDLDLVQAVSGRRESEVVEAVDALLARQMITEVQGQYWFNHGLVRTTVCHDLGHARRRLLQRRAEEALEKLRPNDAVNSI